MNGLLTTKQASIILGVNLYTLYSYIYAGTLRAHKLGGYNKKRHWRIKEQDLEAFINGQPQAGVGSEHIEPKSNKKVKNSD